MFTEQEMRNVVQAERLRAQAREDDAKAHAAVDDDPSWSDYLERRATIARRMANDTDGGLGHVLSGE